MIASTSTTVIGRAVAPISPKSHTAWNWWATRRTSLVATTSSPQVVADYLLIGWKGCLVQCETDSNSKSPTTARLTSLFFT